MRGSNFAPIFVCLMLLSIGSSVLVAGSHEPDIGPSGEENDDLVLFSRGELIARDASVESLTWNSFGPGISAGDFDNDGDMDLYISARFSHLEFDPADVGSPGVAIGAGYGAQVLLENRGNMVFRDVTNASGLFVDSDGDSVGDDTSISGIWGDYDDDGFIDLYVSQFGHTRGKEFGGKANILYHNNGDGTFSDVTAIAGVGNAGHSSVAQWVDYDHDGDIDLYSLNFGYYYFSESEAEGETNILYRNEGGGTFSDQTNEAGLSGSAYFSDIDGTFMRTGLSRVDLPAGTASAPSSYSDSMWGSGMSWAALWFDYDGDGWEDVFIASDFGISPLYRNNRDGTFTVVTEEAGLGISGTGMGADAGDYDRDGDLDICQSNVGPNYLWNNQGDGTFVESGDAAGLNIPEPVHWVCEFFDYDLDGDLDLFFSVGQISLYVSYQENSFWVNNGDGSFTEMAYELNLIPYYYEKTQGTSIVDLDNDGDLDMVTGNSNAPIRIFENLAEHTGRHWLMIDLVGQTSNLHGIGAEVKVHAGGEVYVQQKFACSGSFGCSDARLHFGLNHTTSIDKIVVNWPRGDQTVLRDVAVDQVLVIEEVPERQLDFKAFAGLVAACLILFGFLHFKK